MSYNNGYVPAKYRIVEKKIPVWGGKAHRPGFDVYMDNKLVDDTALSIKRANEIIVECKNKHRAGRPCWCECTEFSSSGNCTYCAWKGDIGPGAMLKKVVAAHNQSLEVPGER